MKLTVKLDDVKFTINLALYADRIGNIPDGFSSIKENLMLDILDHLFEHKYLAPTDGKSDDVNLNESIKNRFNDQIFEIQSCQK